MQQSQQQRRNTLIGGMILLVVSMLVSSAFLLYHIQPKDDQKALIPILNEPEDVEIASFLNQEPEKNNAFYYHALAVMSFCFILTLIISWSLARWYYVEPLHQLMREMRGMRLGLKKACSNPRMQAELDGIQQEFMHLHESLNGSQEDLKKYKSAVKQKLNNTFDKFRRDVRFLKQKTNLDGLTGLSNRGHFDKKLPEYFELAKNTHVDLTCMMIDMDNFKQVNDTQGHAMGDEAINFLGDLLQACVRDCDFVARYGGDEFVMLLPNCTQQEATEIAERIRSHFAQEASRFSSQTNDDGVTQIDPSKCLGISIGIASIFRHRPQDANHLLHLADKALYQAKNQGRNCVVMG